MSLTLGNISLNSRLFLGTARYPSPAILRDAIKQSATEVITVSLRRQSLTQDEGGAFWDYVKDLGCHILPNTAGCYGAKEAIVTAQMAREIFNTHWIKLEVIGDDYTLQPDPFGLLEAAKELIAQGFEVFPYCTDDLILCQRLVDVGCKILMPWAAPIGSAKGLLNPYALKTLRERLPEVILIVDAGIGAPSHAAAAMELGFDAVLLNSAVALAQDPVKMAVAFAKAIEAGHLAANAGLLPARDLASPSTPVLGTPFWSKN